MRRAETIAGVRAAVAAARAGGARIGFVPTMGFLHEGHLRLVEEARRQAGFVVMSIFVNPLQFAPSEDLDRYPRDPEGDAAKAEARGVDVLFTPPAAEMYPRPMRVSIVPTALADRWEGAVRPGHFAGVLTVVGKLFEIVAPDVAVFGQKDFQQAALVRAMAHDLAMPTRVVVSPTVREEDGLAMSSRNSYLDPEERARARALSGALRAIVRAFREGTTDVEALLRHGRAALEAEPGVTLEYLTIADAETLEPVTTAGSESVAMIAARVGGTRLLDNARLDEEGW